MFQLRCNTLFTYLVAVLLISIAATSEALERCGTPPPTANEQEAVSKAIEAYESSGLLMERTTTLNIPVAVHVVRHNDGVTGDVTDAQIQAQLDVLNGAYNPHGYQFNRVSTDRTNNTAWSQHWMGSSEETAMKLALAISPATTLNFYICESPRKPDGSLGLLGYATFPDMYSENSHMHGVVVLYSSLPGGSSVPYNLGDTGTHEVGHYMCLYHTFQGGCSAPGDQIDDTPYEESPAYGCPVGRDTCPAAGLDPVENFMDYSDDSCMNHFTTGQEARIDSCLQVYKPTLWDGGGACSAGQIEDCNGNCYDASWVGDGYCDDGTYGAYFNCDPFCGQGESADCGGDCGGGGTECPAGQVEDCNGNCYDANWVGDGYCDDGTYGAYFNCDPFCGQGESADCGGVCDGGGTTCPAGQIEDCNGNCYDASWVGDGYCDDGTWGAVFNCDPFCGEGELGDCGGVCGGGGTECPAGQVEDCNGNCYDASWVGDGYCDDGTWGAVFNCDPFCGQGESGDCGGDCDGGGTECPAGQVEDCNGNCYDASWVGDGYCDDGTWGAVFNCDPFCGQGESGDCGGDCDGGGTECPAGQVEDCDGNCAPESWATDSVCDAGPTGANFMCSQFNYDAGACLGTTCDVNKIWDCIGNCEWASWLGDGTYCDDDTSDSSSGYADFSCIAADNGDCLPGAWDLSYDWGCGGSPGHAVWTINSDGTFTVTDAPGGGTWTLSGSVITLTYSDDPAIYTGTVSGNHMEGTMVAGSSTGCWTADKGGGATIAAVTSANDASKDSAGNTR